MAHSIRFPRRHDKADRNGRYAVRLCITKNKRRKYIALDLYADPAYWDEAGEQFIILRNLKGAEQKAENKQREADNALLAKYKVRAREIVERFEIEGIDWTLNQFEDAFLNTSKQGKFNAYFSDRIAELHATGHIGNSQTYKQTQDMLRSYDRKLDQRLFSDIDLRSFSKLIIRPALACTDNVDYRLRFGSGEGTIFRHYVNREFANYDYAAGLGPTGREYAEVELCPGDGCYYITTRKLTSTGETVTVCTTNASNFGETGPNSLSLYKTSSAQYFTAGSSVTLYGVKK